MLETPAETATAPASGRLARALLIVQAGIALLGAVGMGLWVVLEEPWSPDEVVGRDLTVEEVTATLAFVAFALVTLWAWQRLRSGRPMFAIVFGAVMLLLTVPSLFTGPELAWLAAMQVVIVVSAWRARQQAAEVRSHEPGAAA